MARVVQHQITLMAFTRNEDGTESILDIVETSFRNASTFTRAWLRDPTVSRIRSMPPRGSSS